VNEYNERRKAEADRRAAEMWCRYQEEGNLRGVAAKEGISHERVRQILERAGYPVRKGHSRTRVGPPGIHLANFKDRPLLVPDALPPIDHSKQPDRWTCSCGRLNVWAHHSCPRCGRRNLVRMRALQQQAHETSG